MRLILFILMLLPVISFGQSDEQNALLEKKSDGKLNFISADKTMKQPAVKKEGMKKKLKDDIVYTGNVKFTIGSNEITCDSAISYENEEAIAVYHVKVSHPQSFVIRGDAMRFNKEDALATMTSNITITAMNGLMIGTSESFDFDFNYDRYRISNGSITPPKENEKN